MTQVIPFLTIIGDLLDESKPFPARALHRFSDMKPDELGMLSKAWHDVPTLRKYSLLDDLEELSETDTLTSFEDLGRSLLMDIDPQVRLRAIRLLWECEDENLAPVLLEMMQKDANVDVQAAAANALGKFIYLGEVDKIPAELQQEIENDLLSAVKSSKKLVLQRRALESLGYSGRDEVIPLIEAAYLDKNPDWVASSLFAMGHSCDERWKKQVLSQLRAPNEDIRSQAIHAAGELELKSARTILLDLLEDEEDLELRHEVIWALSQIGGEGVRAKLEEFLEVEEDDQEVLFIEEALDALSFTEDMGGFSLIDVDPDVDFIEEETEEE